MKRIAFKMKLHAGMEDEYRRRHDSIWPELTALLKKSGMEDYSIFLEEETHTLFAVLKVRNEISMNELPKQAIMKQWWSYMKDMMECNPDHSPVSIPLKEIFYLP